MEVEIKLYNNTYKKVERIGRGAYGKINLVSDTNNPDQYYAMKKIFRDRNHYIRRNDSDVSIY